MIMAVIDSMDSKVSMASIDSMDSADPMASMDSLDIKLAGYQDTSKQRQGRPGMCNTQVEICPECRMSQIHTQIHTQSIPWKQLKPGWPFPS